MGRIALAGGMTKVFDLMSWAHSFWFNQMIRHFVYIVFMTVVRGQTISLVRYCSFASWPWLIWYCYFRTNVSKYELSSSNCPIMYYKVWLPEVSLAPMPRKMLVVYMAVLVVRKVHGILDGVGVGYQSPCSIMNEKIGTSHFKCGSISMKGSLRIEDWRRWRRWRSYIFDWHYVSMHLRAEKFTT